eukprot:UN14463
MWGEITVHRVKLSERCIFNLTQPTLPVVVVTSKFDEPVKNLNISPRQEFKLQAKEWRLVGPGFCQASNGERIIGYEER